MSFVLCVLFGLLEWGFWAPFFSFYCFLAFVLYTFCHQYFEAESVLFTTSWPLSFPLLPSPPLPSPHLPLCVPLHASEPFHYPLKFPWSFFSGPHTYTFVTNPFSVEYIELLLSSCTQMLLSYYVHVGTGGSLLSTRQGSGRRDTVELPAVGRKSGGLHREDVQWVVSQC